MRRILPTNLFNRSFQNRTEIYPEILRFPHSSRSPTLPYANRGNDQITLNTLFVSFCFCDRISSNNLTNKGMFQNQSLTGELQEPACLSEHAFFSFPNLTSYLACNGNNSKANFRLENKVAFAQSQKETKFMLA